MLGERPVRNVVYLLESKGVRIFSLVEDTSDMDAFSFWNGERPFVFLNTQKSAERSRFDAAHELGHLILHRHAGPQGEGKGAEREADAFASAFLMPASSIKAIRPQECHLSGLIALKAQWVVSLAALAYRLHSVGTLSDWHYRSLCIEMAKKGFHHQEPASAQREMSQILAKVFSALRAQGTSKANVAAELHIPTEELERLVFGLVMIGVETGSSGLSSPRRGGHLKLVT